MKKIILDTNFLLIPYQFNVDIYGEIKRIADFRYELYIMDKTLEELTSIIKKQRGKHRFAAMLALLLLKNKKVKQLKTKGRTHVDDLILAVVDKDWIVATQDGALKRKLKKKGIPLIVLRQRKHLVFQE